MSKVKVMVLISAKPGITHEFFKDYYENRHVPLVTGLLPMIKIYRRNYFTPADVSLRAGGEMPDFDVITELEFPSRVEFDHFARAFSDPEVFAKISADEENFVDRKKARRILVEEHGS